jgi:putative aminopeptidase FrvX
MGGDLVALLRRLSEARGPSGYERAVAEVVAEELAPLADEIKRDALGNVIALKRGTPGKWSLLLAAHMDEVGLMVSCIRGGFLQWTPMGRLDRRMLLGQDVVVHGRRDLSGVVGGRPPHVLSAGDRAKVPPSDGMLIDVGLPPEEVEALVQVGDPITLRGKFQELREGHVSGRALDDRCGVTAVIDALRRLGKRRHAWDVYVMATVQEEVGLRGAGVGAYGLRPDLAVAVDATFGQAPGVPEASSYPLGRGPAIGWGPNFHPQLFDRLLAEAEEAEIPYQVEPIPGRSGTDAWAIQVSREGVPCALLSPPLRNMHTPMETICVEDVERTARLLAAFAERLDESFAEEMGLSLKKGGGDATR